MHHGYGQLPTKLLQLPPAPHILFISYDGLTDPLGQSQVLPYLVGLSRKGYRFTILSAEKPSRFSAGKKKIEGQLAGLDIKWAPVKYHKWPPVISSVYDVSKFRREAMRLHESDPFEMVHTRAGLPALVGLWLKHKTGIRFLHDIREFYADGRVDGNLWKQDKFYYRKVYRYFKKKEEEEVRASDGIVCLTQAAKQIIKRLPEYDKKIPVEVIPCGVDLALFNPETVDEEEKQEVRNHLDFSQDDFVVSYLGSLGSWYMTDELLRLCVKVMKLVPATRLLFITPHARSEIEKLCRENNIPVDQLAVVHASRADVPKYLAISDLSVFFIKPCFSKLSSSPTKHGEMMAMGIPVVTNAGVGDLESIIKDTSSGIVVSDFSAESLGEAADKIKEIYENPGKKFLGKVIAAGAEKYYSLEKAIEKYKSLYDTIVKRL